MLDPEWSDEDLADYSNESADELDLSFIVHETIASDLDELDETYCPDDNYDETITTSINETLETDVLHDMIRERGDAPTNLKRRDSAKLNRCVRASEKSRCTGGYTTIKTNLPPLCGTPADLGWSEKLVRRTRPKDFTPNKTPGVVNVRKNDDPLETFLKIIGETLDNITEFSNQK